MKRIMIFLTATAALFVFAGLFTSCGPRRETLHIFNWAVYTPQSVIEAFEREFDVRVIYTEFASNEEMLARLLAAGGGGGFDVVFPSGCHVAIMMYLDMLEPLNHSLLPNLANIDPAVTAKATFDPTMQFAVPYFFGAAGIVVNTQMVPEFERDISIFARTDLAGRMTMLDDPRQVLGDALQVLGFSVNSENPQEIAAARDHIMTHWRPNLVRFDAEAFGPGFANGDFWVVQAWAEAVFFEIMDDPHMMNYAYFFIPPGASSFTDNMVIPRGSRNIELAHEFINFIHRPEIYAMFVDEFFLPATVNVPARGLTRVTPWYTLDEAFNQTGEMQSGVGHAAQYFTDAWFNHILIGN